MEDIEVFIYFEPDVAIQIVRDLLNENKVWNGLDKETRNFALKVRKCPNFNFYSDAAIQQSK